ncbi:MAG TPA: enoyl-CoA hydratase/isomerase family protein, partial [Reyranella sp.]|nr:enoyl-CoA hydratase/isomerase family protein [Reyranella sp.]
MTQSLKCLRASIVRNVGWLEFNRPPVNAFTREMVDETHDAIAAALADPAVRVLVLASAVPRYFSAGADLHVFKDIGQDGMRRWAERCHQIVRLLRGSPKPLLAAINGTAVGGGLEMTLHCDLRFAATDARLGQPEINIGFIPPIATTQALARLIGRPRAMRYLYGGALVPAAEALDWGL